MDEAGRVRVYLERHSLYSYGMESTVKILYENAELKSLLRTLWQRNGWDWQIVESNYQYTPNRRLSEIMPHRTDKHGEEDFVRAALKVIHE